MNITKNYLANCQKKPNSKFLFHFTPLLLLCLSFIMLSCNNDHLSQYFLRNERLKEIYFIFFCVINNAKLSRDLFGKNIAFLLRITIIQPTLTINYTIQIHTQLHFNKEVYLCHHLLYNIIV